jgi:hypothetical protein
MAEPSLLAHFLFPAGLTLFCSLIFLASIAIGFDGMPARAWRLLALLTVGFTLCCFGVSVIAYQLAWVDYRRRLG